MPSKEQVEGALLDVGHQHLMLSNGRLSKDEQDITIDLGGIAKGYAIGEAVKVLKAQGINSALIDAGGDVYALGKKGKEFWGVGIRDPQGEGILGYLEVENLAVMGSGNYERFFEDNGRKAHHILDPKTGYPAEGLSGITVVYPDPTIADAWATALFVMGPQKGLQIVKKIPGMETIMVTSSGEILYSAGLKNALKSCRG